MHFYVDEKIVEKNINITKARVCNGIISVN